MRGREVTDLTIVTGWGKGANLKEGESAKLRTNTRRLLERGFDPPLAVVDVPGNPGRLMVPMAQLSKWCAAQVQAAGGERRGGGE